MKRFICLIIVVFYLSLTSAQVGSVVFNDKPFIVAVQTDSAILHSLLNNTAYTLMSREEKATIYWINYVRTNPKQFIHQVLNPLTKQFPELNTKYLNTLVLQLNTLTPLAPLEPSSKLNQIASDHSLDLANNPTSGISHHSATGKSFQERMVQYGYQSCISENIYEGKEDGLFAVTLLLIDEGVKTLGHRKNILDPQMTHIGISFSKVSGTVNRYLLVQNFSCK